MKIISAVEDIAENVGKRTIPEIKIKLLYKNNELC